MAAGWCSSLALMLLLLSCCAASSAAAGKNKKLTHLHFYFHEVIAGSPNATAVKVAGQHMSGPSAFGDVAVFDNALRVGADPASRLIGRVHGFGVNASLDGTSISSALDFVFSGDYGEYTGSTLAAQGQFDPTGKLSERTIVGGTGKFRFARGYLTNKLVGFTNTTIVVVFDLYFTTRVY